MQPGIEKRKEDSSRHTKKEDSSRQESVESFSNAPPTSGIHGNIIANILKRGPKLIYLVCQAPLPSRRSGICKLFGIEVDQNPRTLSRQFICKIPIDGSAKGSSIGPQPVRRARLCSCNNNSPSIPCSLPILYQYQACLPVSPSQSVSNIKTDGSITNYVSSRYEFSFFTNEVFNRIICTYLFKILPEHVPPFPQESLQTPIKHFE